MGAEILFCHGGTEDTEEKRQRGKEVRTEKWCGRSSSQWDEESQTVKGRK